MFQRLQAEHGSTYLCFPTFGNLRQEDCHKSKTILGSTVRPCLKTKTPRQPEGGSTMERRAGSPFPPTFGCSFRPRPSQFCLLPRMLGTKAQAVVPVGHSAPVFVASSLPAAAPSVHFCLILRNLLGLLRGGGATESIERYVEPAVDVSVDGMVLVTDFPRGQPLLHGLGLCRSAILICTTQVEGVPLAKATVPRRRRCSREDCTSPNL